MKRLCPCGCGKQIGVYNGVRAIVCYPTWRRVDRDSQCALMLPGYSIDQRRAAARRVFEIAHTIKQQRMPVA